MLNKAKASPCRTSLSLLTGTCAAMNGDENVNSVDMYDYDSDRCE